MWKLLPLLLEQNTTVLVSAVISVMVDNSVMNAFKITL